MSTDRDYTARLQEQTGKGWKRLFGAQVPYRRHIRRVVEGRVLVDGRPTAYLCRNFACRLPVTDADALRRQLDGEAATA